MKVVVVGMGKMGLPLSCAYARAGYRVVGCDVRQDVIDAVNRGECPVAGEEGLEPLMRQLVEEGVLAGSTDTTEAVREADVVVMIPPLKLNEAGAADYRAIDGATEAVARGLSPGTLVVYETTVAVGDTRDRFGGILSRVSGLRAGEDYGLAFSPERVFMGRIFQDLDAYPKIVGGVNEYSTSAALKFYTGALRARVVRVANTETAEFVKLAETTYRDVNIALANELAVAAVDLGIDAVEAFELANTQPFSHIHSPGVGVGGHCIPVYPQLLMSVVPQLRLPRVARDVNDGMPQHVVDVLESRLGDLKGKRICLLGLSYRGDVAESTLSPTLEAISLLLGAGSDVYLADPWFTDSDITSTGAKLLIGKPVGEATVIMTKHSVFRDVDLGSGGIVVDGRPGAWAPEVGVNQELYIVGRGWR